MAVNCHRLDSSVASSLRIMFQILHILSRCFDTLSFFFASYKLKGRSLLSWSYLKIRDGFSAIGLPSSGHDRINSPMRASIVVPMLNKFFFLATLQQEHWMFVLLLGATSGTQMRVAQKKKHNTSNKISATRTPGSERRGNGKGSGNIGGPKRSITCRLCAVVLRVPITR